MENKNILLKLNSNYGDEFDVDGFLIMDTQKWSDSKKLLQDYDREIESFFGSNEYLYWENGPSFLEEVKEIEISEEEEKFLKRIFKSNDFGFGDVIEDVINIVKNGGNEEDEYEDDDEVYEDDDEMCEDDNE